MEHSMKNINQYLAMCPKLENWINHCPICGARGRKPEMPDSVGGFNGNAGSHNLKRMLPVLEVDEDGFCLTCSRLYRKK